MASRGLPGWSIAAILIAVLLGALFLIYYSQVAIEKQIKLPAGAEDHLKEKKTAHEISKIDAEIRRIRSDTLGSLFWLKLIALFVSVGSAVGGYLVGQSRTARAHIEFEDRKNVDAVYQSIVKELSDESAVLRAAAAVKLGSVLGEFPHEWNVSDTRKRQLLELTKKVLAAALSIEDDPKVLKTLTINIALHKPWAHDGVADQEKPERADLRELDLSGAKAEDAFWARCDLTYADLYKAHLRRASMRHSILDGAQFRETDLRDAVLADTKCRNGTNFKLADLRGADFSGADLTGASFEAAKVHGVNLKGAQLPSAPEGDVDLSEAGDGSKIQSADVWLA